jgi:histidyl-tRNA synthetase
MPPVARVKGTQDFYPDDWAQQIALREIMLAAGRGYGYREYEGPAIEYLDLYLDKSSEEIVTRQTFRIQDRDGKALLLRPELTPTLARMIAAREREITLPARWQSFGQFFRYERPQRGRGRSFFQWNVDLLGSESAVADAEVIQVACALFRALGLGPTEVQIRINDRAAMETDLTGALGVAAEQVRGVLAVIDRLDKVGGERAVGQLVELGLGEGQAGEVVAFVEAPVTDPAPRLATVMEQLANGGNDEYVRVDRAIARGFDYYTGTVFEAWATGDLRRAIFGGGRYDDLTRQVGGKQRIPGVGMAVGDLALLELLRELDRVPAPAAGGPEAVVTVFDPASQAASARISEALRRHGVAVELCLDPGQRLDRQLKHADRVGARHALIIGPDEAADSAVMVKDLRRRTQERHPASDAAALAALAARLRKDPT